MQNLQLIGVHEDGEHLLLGGADDQRFLMPVDDSLRAAIRRDRPRLGQQQIEVGGGLRPRDVQALIRAGASAEEAARRAGWTVEKVHRFEGPILAEREHVASLAQQARLRSHIGGSNVGTAATLAARVTDRLKARDVEATDASWDSWRNEGGPWTVVLTFAAGGRQRQASWSFDLADRSVSAVDDEARWLSEEVQEAKGPIPAPMPRPATGRKTTVYDVEAEGGMRPSTGEQQEDPLDLMSAMRKRSSARGRRRAGSRGDSRSTGSSSAASTLHAEEPAAEQALPLGELSHTVEPALTARQEPGSPEVPDSDDRSAPDRAADLRELADEEATKVVSPGDSPTGDSPTGDTSSGDTSSGDSPGDTSSGDTSPRSGDVHDSAETSAGQNGPNPPPKKPAREAGRKTGRPSVPAWDEIMFGSRPGVDRSSS